VDLGLLSFTSADGSLLVAPLVDLALLSFAPTDGSLLVIQLEDSQ
jgi:hypothetical protein